MKLLLLLTLILAPFTLSYTQENQSTLTRLANISNQPDVLAKVTEIFIHDEKRFSNCTEFSRPEPRKITVFNEPKFSIEFLEEGIWQIRYDVTVCQQNRRRTALFQVKNGENLSIISLLPGDTLADMNLQADTRRSLFLSGAKLAPNCKTPFVTQTQVTQRPQTPNDAWQEIWTADFCNKKIAQTIDFTPNSDGTSFSMAVLP